MKKRVVIIQQEMKRYRLPLYEALYRKLERQGVELEVLYSLPRGRERLKADSGVLPSSYGCVVPVIGGQRCPLVYQFCLKQILSADLVIVEQANRHVVNYLLILLSALGRTRLAFWGHGRNRQAEGFGWRELFKQRLITYSDWWFAYNQGTVDYLIRCGVNAGRISNVVNCTDVTAFRHQIESLTASELTAFRERLGIPADACVGLFCGGMYEEKEIPFLITALFLIRRKHPRFWFVFAGAGPTQCLVDAVAREHAWVVNVGPVFGRDKALCFAVAQILLNPGLVGLGVLDGFAAGLVMVTTASGKHSPEIDYLKPDQNGVRTEKGYLAFVDGVVELLANPGRIDRLSKAACETSFRFSIENMADKFSRGIVSALDVGP